MVAYPSTETFTGWRRGLSCLVISLALATSAAAAEVPAKKQSSAQLYMTSVEAADALHDSSVAFIDVRSRAEVAFLGLPTRVDVNIPYMMMPAIADFDTEKAAYKLEINPEFPTVFEAYVKAHGYSKDSTFVLICRSGSRSAKAASLLYNLGYKKVYSVLDGYEGDKAKEGPHKGQRVINGWRNNGLEWTYKIKSTQVYPDDLG